MSKVIITGVTGFIGGNLKDHLKNDFEILGVSRFSDEEESIINYNDLNLEELNSSDVLIHLAGISKSNSKNKNELNEVNFELTKKIFNLFLDSDCKCFIYLSSIKALTEYSHELIDENFLPKPISEYGKSKLKSENHILQKTKNSPKRVFILRPVMVYGNGQKNSFNTLIKLIKVGLPKISAGYNNKRSYLSVENLCFIIETLIKQKEIKSNVFNLADDSLLSTNELISVLASSLKKNKIKEFSISQNKIEGLKKILSSKIEDKINKLTKSCMVSNKKVKEVLKIEFPIDSREGISKIIISSNS